MKVSIATFALLALASASQADITSYAPHSNQAANDSYYDPGIPFFTFTHSNGGSPAWVNLNDSYHGNFASARYDQDINAFSTFIGYNANALQFSGDFFGSTSVSTSNTTDVLCENFSDQYVDFTLDSAGVVSINLQGSQSTTGYANNFVGVWFDGNLIGSVPSYINSFAVGAGNHTIRMEFQEESLAGLDYGVTSSSTSTSIDYSVVVSSSTVPEPATMAGLIVVGTAGYKRRKKM